MAEQKASPTIKAILFDLDGTLLRGNMKGFIRTYIEKLSSYCSDVVKPEEFAQALLTTIRDLINTEGDGSLTNKERVYSKIHHKLALPEAVLQECLLQLKMNDLPELQRYIHPIPLAKQIIKECQQKDIPLVLATNPVFPKFMIQARMNWAELEEDAFAYLTSYENSYYCKPHAGYFQGIADELGIATENCLMVGNDLSHDLAAGSIGMKTFLVDTWLVDRGGPSWPCDHRGDHAALQDFLQKI